RDQMQLVLDDQVRRSERFALQHADRRQRAALRMGAWMLLSSGEVAVALTAARDLPEKRLHLALPWHPCELVDSRDHQRRQQPVDLLVDDNRRQTLARTVAQRKRALARHV